MSEIRLALDLDGVVFDFNTHFIDLSRKMCRANECPDADDTFPDEWNYMLKYVSKSENRRMWDHIIKESPDFWATCPTYDHSDELLVTAQCDADKLYFLTSRCGPKVQKQTVEALKLAAPGLTLSGGVIPVTSPEHKIPIINALHITHFVDDKPETIREAWEKCPNTEIAIWDQPWNRQWGAFAPGLKRLHNVKEFDQWLSSRSVLA